MPSETSATWPSRESNLPHQAHEVVEEPLLHDLPLLVPCGHRAELHVETLPGRLDDRPLRGLHWSLHRAGEFRDGARVVAVREENLVRAVDEVVVREGLEEFNGFHVMVVPAIRGWGPAGPVHGNIFGVTLSEGLAKAYFISDGPAGEAPLAQYFTQAFFQEVANRLNADPEWSRKGAAITAKVVLTCVDRKASFLIDVVNGTVSSTEVAADVPADFKFEGTYDAWTQLGKGEKDFQSLVMGGKIRFRGSMPKIMALMGVLSRITGVARDVPKDFCQSGRSGSPRPRWTRSPGCRFRPRSQRTTRSSHWSQLSPLGRAPR